MSFPDQAQFANLPFIEELYLRYKKGENDIDPSWRHFFEGIDFGEWIRTDKTDPALRIFSLIQTYRRFGHLQASFNPMIAQKTKPKILELSSLGFSEGERDQLFPSFGFASEKMAPLIKIIEKLEQIYCGSIGYEYSDFSDPIVEQWIQQEIESKKIEFSPEEKQRILEELNRSEIFETFLHTKYTGQKRFSLEGEETLLPILQELTEEGSLHGMEEIFLGMSHRGRLNILVNFLQKKYSVLFREFEDTAVFEVGGSDDVKYHKGFSSEISTRAKKNVILHLTANPSHLEAVDPVVLGQTYARQKKKKKEQVASILIHGDAAISGQGVVYESLQLMNLPGYSVGGTIHIVLNNQIGFTTTPEEGRSTRYCTDLAKTFRAPVFHLNAEDPEGCVFAARLAARIRQKFHCDVFLELNGYRKYGHNEGDEPSFTQPAQQRAIRKKKSIREIYLQKLGSIAQEMETAFKNILQEALSSAQAADQALAPHEILGHAWEDYFSQRKNKVVSTSVPADHVKTILKKTAMIPDGFQLHPKLKKLFEDRLTASRFDWSSAEWLAFGSLLLEKIPIRCSGQDMRRGTFSQRHMAWVDQENETRYFPLAHLEEGQGNFEIFNSPLSEYAVLGFELGYSWSSPQSLVIWEAQFGDFFNGAQIIVDQFISSAEQKWNRSSSLVLLLPHALEGQGPEHSSGRIERFLQLCANDNMQVVNPSTPAQYFHLLRRQALQPRKTPLIVFTPKSLLRDPACSSPMEDFTDGSFEEILDDPQPPKKAKKMLLCSGRIFYDLLQERKERQFRIVRIEQLYPLNRKKLKALFKDSLSEVRYVQEEPQNMGAWEHLRPQILELLPAKVSLKYVGREASASPAVGSHRKHKEEMKTLLREAFS